MTPARVVGITSKYPRVGKGTAARALLEANPYGAFQQVDFADALRRALVRCLGGVYAYDPGARSTYRLVSEAAWLDDCKPWIVVPRPDALIRAAAVIGAEVGGEQAYAFAKWLDQAGDAAGTPCRTIRQILQRLGTEVYRAKNENHWVEEWDRRRWAITRSDRPAIYDRETGFCDVGTGAPRRSVVATDVRFPNEARRIRELRTHRDERVGFVVRLDAPWAAPPSDGIAGHASDAGLPDELVDATVDVPPHPGADGHAAWASDLGARFLRALPFPPDDGCLF